jgi:hypothetical protein
MYPEPYPNDFDDDELAEKTPRWTVRRIIFLVIIVIMLITFLVYTLYPAFVPPNPPPPPTLLPLPQV